MILVWECRSYTGHAYFVIARFTNEKAAHDCRTHMIRKWVSRDERSRRFCQAYLGGTPTYRVASVRCYDTLAEEMAE